jgi:4-hydroxy-tetrahydrodipicolinate reductase
MADLRIGIAGCAGRMGQMLARTIKDTPGVVLAAGNERPGSPAIGQDLGEVAGIGKLGVAVVSDAAAMFAGADAVLDFTAPVAALAHCQLAAERKVILVLGTTGLEAEHFTAIDAAAKRTTILQAANYSVGVTLLTELTRQVARTLDPDFDIEVVEMHHRHKVDAPSGTALALGHAAAAGRGVEHDAVAARGRDGITGARRRGDIGYAALRGGNVAGDHTVVFAADNERLELTHKAGDRAIFARGAVRAALWARGKPPGRYNMVDVLGLAR